MELARLNLQAQKVDIDDVRIHAELLSRICSCTEREKLHANLREETTAQTYLLFVRSPLRALEQLPASQPTRCLRGSGQTHEGVRSCSLFWYRKTTNSPAARETHRSDYRLVQRHHSKELGRRSGERRSLDQSVVRGTSGVHDTLSRASASLIKAVPANKSGKKTPHLFPLLQLRVSVEAPPIPLIIH